MPPVVNNVSNCRFDSKSVACSCWNDNFQTGSEKKDFLVTLEKSEANTRNRLDQVENMKIEKDVKVALRFPPEV